MSQSRIEAQRERSRINAQRWRLRNPDAARRAAREWCQRNPEKVRANNRRSRVRPYDSTASKAWRAQRLTTPGYRERVNRQANMRATTVRCWLDAYKLRVGCVDCGYRDHHAALHFDHVRGNKALNVCNAKSLTQAQSEIEKCEVRCANCHAVRTFKRHPCKPEIFAMTYEAVES